MVQESHMNNSMLIKNNTPLSLVRFWWIILCEFHGCDDAF